jgi:hypothetical protein
MSKEKQPLRQLTSILGNTCLAIIKGLAGFFGNLMP